MGSDNSAPQLECDDDSGNFEARQNNDRQHWCVSPMSGMEIPGTRRDRSMRLNCDRMGMYNIMCIILKQLYILILQYFRIAV